MRRTTAPRTRDGLLGIIATINALGLTAASAWEQNHWRMREAALRVEAGAITLTEDETIAQRSREKQEAFRPYLPRAQAA